MIGELDLSLGVWLELVLTLQCLSSYTIARLIGSAPGLVGYEEGGKLVPLISFEPSAYWLRLST